MQAVTYEAFGGPLAVRNVPDPHPSPDGVVIEVRATGVCRSDWHGWQGHDPDIRTLPHVPGHELAGVVREIGRDVLQWRPGDRVTIPFVAGCGGCATCRRGAPQVCPDQYQPGFTGWGSFAEAVAVRYADYNLVRIPEEISFAAAASCGCRLGTAFRAVAQQGQVQAGDWLAVFGCGGVGLSAVMVGAALGARVIAVDIQPAALALAQQLGAEIVVDAGEHAEPAATIAEMTGGGVDVALDALGSIATASQSILSLRRQGRHVQVGLLAGAEAAGSLPMGRVIGWELQLVGSHGIAAVDYAALWDWTLAGRLQPERLIAERIALSDVPQALAAMGQFNRWGVAIAELGGPSPAAS
jgi:alcohol dehydrogenase